MESSSEKSVCCSCQSAKAPLTCGMCQESVCKKCTEFIDEGTFSFLPEVPTELSHTTYCRLCFDAKVSAALQDYEELKRQAKEVFVFFKDQNKESRLIKRLEDPLVVPECEDRNETLLRLAFLAVKGNFNVLVEVDITSEKKREGAYQKTIWKGTAVPAYVDPRKLTEKNKWSFVRSDGPSYRTPGARR